MLGVCEVAAFHPGEAWRNHRCAAAERRSSGRPWPGAGQWACSRDASEGSVVACLGVAAGEADAVRRVPPATRLDSGHQPHFLRCQQVLARSSRPTPRVSNVHHPARFSHPRPK